MSAPIHRDPVAAWQYLHDLGGIELDPQTLFREAVPSLTTPGTWKQAVPPPHERVGRWWLVDTDNLRHKFRDEFLTQLFAVQLATFCFETESWRELP